MFKVNNKNTRTMLMTKVGGLVTKNICFWFIATCALLQSHTEFNRISLHVIPVGIIVPCT